jgi:hypothetical protein
VAGEREKNKWNQAGNRSHNEKKVSDCLGLGNTNTEEKRKCEVTLKRKKKQGKR